MKKQKPNNFLFISALFLASPLQAKILLPSVFGDNMVLQQQSEVAIWGWGIASEEVKVVGSWNSSDTAVATVQNNSYWKATLKTGEAGGPYTLNISGSSKISIENVMLGEVWICSGQSNMGLNFNDGIKDGEQEVANAKYPEIRIFHIAEIGHDYPQQDCSANWTECTPSTVRTTSALAYFYGRELHQKLNVPVGIIVSAWGGTPAEVWLRKELVEDDSILKKAADELIEYPWWPHLPGVVYNGMIAL